MGTTANSIQFGDQWQFTTTNPNAPPLLTVNPSALLFNQLTSQLGSSIAVLSDPNLPENDRPRLQVPTGESLILIGGNISPTNAATGRVLVNGGQLFAPGGRIELGGLNSAGVVELVKNNGHWQTHFPADVARSSVILQNQAQLNVRSSGGGDIAIYANDFNLLSDSKLRAGILSGLGSANTQAGDITIDALNQVQLTANSFMANQILDLAQGVGGDIKVNSRILSLEDTSFLSTNLFGQGQGGNIKIQADEISLTDESFLVSQDSGNIEIKGNSLSLSGTASIDTDIYSAEIGGKIILDLDESVSLVGDSLTGTYPYLSAGVSSDAIGSSSGIEIHTDRFLADYAYLDTTTYGIGHAGNIEINTNNEIDIKNTTWLQADSYGVGDSGQIYLNTNRFNLQDSSILFSNVNTGAIGNSKGVSITTGEGTIANFSLIDTRSYGQGNAGDILISGADLTIKDSSTLNANTSGKGLAGNINLDNSGSFNLLGSYIVSNVLEGAIGNGGTIVINADAANISQGAIQSITSGEGSAGNIQISVGKDLTIQDYSLLDSNFNETGSKGSAGEILISSDTFQLLNNSFIGSTTFGQGDAGNVTIQANSNFNLDHSKIVTATAANAVSRGGGNINITVTSGSLTLQNDSSLNSSTLGNGNAGDIDFRIGELLSLDNSKISSAVGQEGTNAIGNGGEINIIASSLEMSNYSKIDSSIFGVGNAGNIGITLGGLSSLNNSQISSTVHTNAIGNGGNIIVSAENVSLLNHGRIYTNSEGNGNAGSVDINVENQIQIQGNGTDNWRNNWSGINSGTNGEWNAGNITVNAQSLTLENRGLINASSIQGNSGDIILDVKNITLQQEGVIGNIKNEGSQGESGTIVINGQNLKLEQQSVIGNSSGGGSISDLFINLSGDLDLHSGSNIQSIVGGSGLGGKIDIKASNIFLDNSTIAGGVIDTGIANAGIISIQSDLLSLINTSVVTSDTSGQGDAGNILIYVDRLLLNNSQISASTSSQGNAGTIDLNASELRLENFSGISSQTQGQGTGGNIFLDIDNSIVLTDRSFVNSTVATAGFGNAGGITITAEVLDLKNAQLNSSTFGKGDAGSITIDAGEISLTEGSSIASVVRSEAVGKGGDIYIRANSLTETQSKILADIFGEGSGGSIHLDLDDRLSLDNSEIVTALEYGAVQGFGGTIDITAPQFILANGSSVTSSTYSRGNTGAIVIQTNQLKRSTMMTLFYSITISF